MARRHINEFRKTTLANTGRAAGMGIVEDNYDNDELTKWREKSYSPFDHRKTHEHGEVIVYKVTDTIVNKEVNE